MVLVTSQSARIYFLSDITMPFDTLLYKQRLHAAGVPSAKAIKVAYILKHSPCVSPPVVRLTQAGVHHTQFPEVLEIWREMHRNVECVVVEPDFDQSKKT